MIFKSSNMHLQCGILLIFVLTEFSFQSVPDSSESISTSSAASIDGSTTPNSSSASCVQYPTCPQSQYRSIDGSCNNEQEPIWGMASTPAVRLLPPIYCDGVHGAPKSQDGTPLPNSLDIRNIILPSKEIPNNLLTAIVMSFGQIVAHDGERITVPNNAPQCCPFTNETDVCLPIPITPDDIRYHYGQNCMNVVRSPTTENLGCHVKPLEQINVVTSYLDCSFLYGSDSETNTAVRLLIDGLLKFQNSSDGQEFPPDASQANGCDRRTTHCYLAGDVRVNQNTQITVIQTIFLRLHNEIARELKKLNPSWNDEKLFQETRRIVIAIYQKITYNDWLPYIVGNKSMEEYNLRPAQIGYSNDYDPNVNAGTINEFATAAYRYFHTLIVGLIRLMDPPSKSVQQIHLSDFMNRSDIIQDPAGNFKKFLNEFFGQACDTADQHFTREMTLGLFKGEDKFGFDLVALDIQRALDHGIAKYYQFRELYFQKKITSFNDFAPDISPKNISLLKQVYKDPRDVALYIGIIFENHVDGALIGPTGLRIVSEQFRRSKVGDRFFFDRQNSPYPFTLPQLDAIRNVTLSSVFCEIEADLQQITVNVWEKISANNSLVNCTQIPKLNLTSFKDEQNGCDCDC